MRNPFLLPVPAVAAGAGPFEVLGSDLNGGCSMPTANEPGLYAAPFDADSALALGVRQHEYGHLGLLRRNLTPGAKVISGIAAQGIHEAWIQGVLDVVVNSYMESRGNREIAWLTPWQDPLPEALPRWLAATLFLRCEGLPRFAALRLEVASRGVFTAPDFRLLHQRGRELWATGETAAALTGKRMLELVRELQDAFGPSDPSAQVPGYVRRFVKARRGPAKWPAPQNPTGNWGAMEVVHLPLTLRGARGGGTRASGPSSSGSFRYPHRALLPSGDGCAFTTKKNRGRAGAALIDCSGSMSVSQEDLRQLLDEGRLATIAAYASAPGTLDHGRLVILARNHRLAEASRLEGMLGIGNVVDGPALRWLCRQPGGRVWISDGHVTGVGDKTGIPLSSEAERLVHRGRIQQFRTLREFLEVHR